MSAVMSKLFEETETSIALTCADGCEVDVLENQDGTFSLTTYQPDGAHGDSVTLSRAAARGLRRFLARRLEKKR